MIYLKVSIERNEVIDSKKIKNLGSLDIKIGINVMKCD